MKAGEFVGEADMRTSTSLPSSSALRFRLVFCCTGVDTIQSIYMKPEIVNRHRISYWNVKEKSGNVRKSVEEQEA